MYVTVALNFLAQQMKVHLPQLLVFFVLRADVYDDRVNPLSQQALDTGQPQL